MGEVDFLRSRLWNWCLMNPWAGKNNSGLQLCPQLYINDKLGGKIDPMFSQNVYLSKVICYFQHNWTGRNNITDFEYQTSSKQLFVNYC